MLCHCLYNASSCGILYCVLTFLYLSILAHSFCSEHFCEVNPCLSTLLISQPIFLAQNSRAGIRGSEYISQNMLYCLFGKWKIKKFSFKSCSCLPFLFNRCFLFLIHCAKSHISWVNASPCCVFRESKVSLPHWCLPIVPLCVSPSLRWSQDLLSTITTTPRLSQRAMVFQPGSKCLA